MVKNRKIKLMLLFLLVLMLSIFSLGHTIEPEFLPSSEAGWKLHPDDHNYHMGSKGLFK